MSIALPCQMSFDFKAKECKKNRPKVSEIHGIIM